jgi:hypothetical protein
VRIVTRTFAGSGKYSVSTSRLNLRSRSFRSSGGENAFVLWLERNQSWCVLMIFVQGRHSLLLAAT